MAFLAESAEWTDGVYQIEKDDDVLGVADGPGPDNKPHIDLAKRTSYLRRKIGTIAEEEL
jgi:hypothetical protein